MTELQIKFESLMMEKCPDISLKKFESGIYRDISAHYRWNWFKNGDINSISNEIKIKDLEKDNFILRNKISLVCKVLMSDLRANQIAQIIDVIYHV